jgi:hypothetical protein
MTRTDTVFTPVPLKQRDGIRTAVIAVGRIKRIGTDPPFADHLGLRSLLLKFRLRVEGWRRRPLTLELPSRFLRADPL